eukprot:COSAG04_NODE_875_length_9692_cov_6.365266_1_plen_107_part_10
MKIRWQLVAQCNGPRRLRLFVETSSLRPVTSAPAPRRRCLNCDGWRCGRLLQVPLALALGLEHPGMGKGNSVKGGRSGGAPPKAAKRSSAGGGDGARKAKKRRRGGK